MGCKDCVSISGASNPTQSTLLSLRTHKGMRFPGGLYERVALLIWDKRPQDYLFGARKNEDREPILKKLLICPTLERHERALFQSQDISVFTGMEAVIDAGNLTLCERCKDKCPLAGVRSGVNSCNWFVDRLT